MKRFKNKNQVRTNLKHEAMRLIHLSKIFIILNKDGIFS